MLRLIPAPAHRAGLRIAHALRVQWWRVRRPRLAGCRVLAFDGEGRVLLVRHSYGSGKWMPPGGALSRGEDAVEGALRELREETGLGLREPAVLAVDDEALHRAGNMVHVVAGWSSGELAIDGREIVAAAFFALDALPDHMPAFLRDGLERWAADWRS